MADVTGKQRLITPARHLIPLLVCLRFHIFQLCFLGYSFYLHFSSFLVYSCHAIWNHLSASGGCLIRKRHTFYIHIYIYLWFYSRSSVRDVVRITTLTLLTYILLDSFPKSKCVRNERRIIQAVWSCHWSKQIYSTYNEAVNSCLQVANLIHV